MDTGCGMSEEVLGRIFRALLHDKKEATGTGLGLWVSAEIVRKHHGKIYIRRRAAEDGQNNGNRRSGTIFMLFFPAVRGEEKPVEILQAGSRESSEARPV